jgi:hypothetical protein
MTSSRSALVYAGFLLPEVAVSRCARRPWQDAVMECYAARRTR